MHLQGGHVPVLPSHVQSRPDGLMRRPALQAQSAVHIMQLDNVLEVDRVHCVVRGGQVFIGGGAGEDAGESLSSKGGGVASSLRIYMQSSD